MTVSQRTAELHLTVTECHHKRSHSVTYHPTEVHSPLLNPSQTGRYSIYLPQRDGRLSWPVVAIVGKSTIVTMTRVLCAAIHCSR